MDVRILPLLLLTAAVPSMAVAGGCPTCTTNEECVISTGEPEALCVTWSMEFGCGQQRTTCCPGQACAISGGGVASCELTADCVRAGAGPGADAAVSVDSGSGDSGGGPPPTDASTDSDGAATVGDARTSTHADAGSVGRLGGGSATRESRCNCEVASEDGAPSAAALLLLGLALVVRRRRR